MKEPSFARALARSDRALKEVDIKRYQYLSSGTGEIKVLDYQKRAVRSATKATSGLWSGELWTGAGKSYVAAWIARHFIPKGKTIFICPNRTGLGSGMADQDDEPEVVDLKKRKRGGIIFKFAEIFNPRDQKGRLIGSREYKLGALNETTRLNDVLFFTPHCFVALKKASPALFMAIVSDAHALIIDEAHHFPGESGDHVVYDKIGVIAREFFLSKRKKVVTLTATHGRTDGKLLIGKSEPDFKMTVQEAVNIGRCPSIHGLRVQLVTRAPNARVIGDLFDLKLRGKALGKYLQEIAGRMLSIQEKNKSASICAFVRTVKEARFLADIWNAEAKSRGYLPLAVLVSKCPEKERQAIKRGIMSGKLQGFITCNVGAESLDIPHLEIVHMIRRTRSIPMLVQSIGRALRMHEGKRRALVVDYHVMEGRVIRACKGICDYAVFAGRTIANKDRYLFESDSAAIEVETENGGSLVVPEGSQKARFMSATIAQEKAWVVKNLDYDDCDEMRFAALMDFTKEKLRQRPRRFNAGVVHRFRGRSYTEHDFAVALKYISLKATRAPSPSNL